MIGLPKPENINLKTEKQQSKLNDYKIRLILIPILGIGISNINKIYKDVDPTEYIFWLGNLYFVLLSFFIWHGNRYFLLEQRKHFDWFNHPLRKVSILLFANIFYTVPVTVLFLYGWYYFIPETPVDWQKIVLISVINVLCVIFITHIYETVYLIQQRQSDLLNFEKLERARTQAELNALRNQIDPHFMFNSLNTLAYLIESSPKKAMAFNQSLSDMYRYILLNKNKKLVLLKDELEFLNNYFALIKLRFGEGIQLSYADVDEMESQTLVPPISLQSLLENAVKHNEFSDQDPLDVDIYLKDSEIIISNLIKPKMNPGFSTGTGLKNLDERYFLLTGSHIRINNKDNKFEVVLPLLKMSL